MANAPISMLPPASGLTGGELVPVVQAGVTKQTTVEQIRSAGGSFDVTSFGAKWDGQVNDLAAIQRAVDACSAAGGGWVDLPTGRGVIAGASIVLPTLVKLRGKGSGCTEIFLASGSNCTMVKTLDYDSMVGTDLWLVADGCPQGIGLVGLRLNGNKAGQVSGSGVQAYGKRMWVQDLMIVQCKNEGWHSESNATIPGAPATNGADMPEGIFTGLYVWECDSHGVVFRGQHDSYLDGVFAGVCGGWGVRIESDFTPPGVYNGSCDIGMIHSYANALGGVYANAQFRAAEVIAENNFGVGLQLDSYFAQIAILQTYDNCRSTGVFNVLVPGYYNTIGQHQHRNIGTLNKSVLQLTGQSNVVSDISYDGAGGTGTGVTIASSAIHSVVQGEVRGFSGSGGVGVVTNSGGTASYCAHTFTITDCATCWNNATAGFISKYKMLIHNQPGQVPFVGQGPFVTDSLETWECLASDGTNVFTSEIRKKVTINMNLSGNQTITVSCAELFGLTPEQEDISVSFSYLGADAVWAFAVPPMVSNITGTTITLKWRMATVAGVGETGQIIVQVSL